MVHLLPLEVYLLPVVVCLLPLVLRMGEIDNIYLLIANFVLCFSPVQEYSVNLIWCTVSVEVHVQTPALTRKEPKSVQITVWMDAPVHLVRLC